MSKLDLKDEHDPQQHRLFMKRLLNEIAAFEALLNTDMVESNVRRIGAEQELFVVSRSGRPAKLAGEILDRIKDPHYTTELAQFNLEFNLDPFMYEKDCFRQMEQQMHHLMDKVRGVAAELDAELVMAGILPTIRQSDLDVSNMTPKPRYMALDKAMALARGGAEYEIRLTGLEELIFKQNSVMTEACNNSFQLHFQVSTQDFAKYYNIAQAITGPILSVAVNSPILFGRRLWHETRIALFQQSTDTRSVGHQIRDRTGRVSFGDRWVDQSIIDLIKEDIARFRVLISVDLEDEDPFEKIKNGVAPELDAMKLHNGTIYRWNRPCYGILNGKPHLRIENRVLPAGPTILDEVANAALFFGLLSGIGREYKDFTKFIEFDDAKANFYTAARQGIGAFMTWTHRKVYPIRELMLQELLPLAREGLTQANIDSSDIDRYLGVIEERVKSGRTGSTWMLHSYLKLQKNVSQDQMLRTLVTSSISRQKEKNTIQDWAFPEFDEVENLEGSSIKVEHVMRTDLYTIHPEELLELVPRLMEWKRMRDIPVEDEKGKFIGMVRFGTIFYHILTWNAEGKRRMIPVKEIMDKAPSAISPSSSSRKALLTLLEKKKTLPVVKDGSLVGIITDHGSSFLIAQVLGEELSRGKPEVKNMTVRELMTKQPCTVSVDTPLRTIVEQMAELEALYAMVTDDDGNLIGMFNYRSVLRESEKLWTEEPFSVEEVMNTDLITVAPEAPILNVINLMYEKKIGCLPVVDGKKLVGLLSEYDLFKIARKTLMEPE